MWNWSFGANHEHIGSRSHHTLGRAARASRSARAAVLQCIASAQCRHARCAIQLNFEGFRPANLASKGGAGTGNRGSVSFQGVKRRVRSSRSYVT